MFGCNRATNRSRNRDRLGALQNQNRRVDSDLSEFLPQMEENERRDGGRHSPVTAANAIAVDSSALALDEHGVDRPAWDE